MWTIFLPEEGSASALLLVGSGGGVERRSTTMAKYLLQVASTSEAWAAQVRNPQNRVEAIRVV